MRPQVPATPGVTPCPRRRRPLLRKHAAGGTDSVERVGLATRTALPAQPTHLEHPLVEAAQEACETGTERACPLDREDTPTWRVPVDEPQSVCVAIAVCGDSRLEHDRATDDVHDRERVRVAVRVDTDDVVQLICEHPLTDLQPWVGGQPVSVWGWKPRTAGL